MSKWVKNTIGLGFVIILLTIAFRLYIGSGGEITGWNFSVKVDPSNIKSTDTLPVEDIGPGECRLPEHGIESWKKIETLTKDSGWRKGGSSPSEFCAKQQIVQQTKYGDSKVVLISTGEKHKSEYTPFKHDFYRYACLFEIKEPVYNPAPNKNCPNNKT